ncbi:MAG: hypothetical protein ACRC46_15115 [Thermoguttaceae bacterium]
MTEYRFYCGRVLEEEFLKRAFFSGWGRVPHHNHSVVYRDGILILSIPEPISGTVSVLVPHPELGVVLESTDTLVARLRPYHLLKELCRGALGRLQRRIADWQTLGFQPSPEHSEQIQSIMQAFGRLVMHDETASDIDSIAATVLAQIRKVVWAITKAVSKTMLEVRMRSQDRIPLFTIAGMNTHSAPESFYEFGIYADELRSVFHSVAPMPTWRELEPIQGQWDWERLDRRVAMAHRYGFQIVGGPILDFRSASLPSWVTATLRQDGALEAFAEAYLRMMIERFDYAVCIWSLVRAINKTDIVGLSVARIIALTRRLSEVVRSMTAEKIVMIGVDQPWGDSNITASSDQYQSQLVETVFSMSAVDAVVLETHLGLHQDESFPRDPIGFGSVIDLWWHSGKNVFISLSVPSSSAIADETGTFGSPKEMPRCGDVPAEIASASSLWSPQTQAAWVEHLMPLFLAKRSVAGLFWSPLQDTSSCPATAAGLIDIDRNIKPAFHTLATFRKEWIR